MFCLILNCDIELTCNIKKLIIVRVLENESIDRFSVVIKDENAKRRLISSDDNDLKRSEFDVNDSDNNNEILS